MSNGVFKQRGVIPVLLGVVGALLVAIALVLAFYPVSKSAEAGLVDCGSVVVHGSGFVESGAFKGVDASGFCDTQRQDRGLKAALFGVSGLVLAIAAGIITNVGAGRQEPSSG